MYDTTKSAPDASVCRENEINKINGLPLIRTVCG